MSNLPLDAEGHPKAPFNRVEKDILVYTTIETVNTYTVPVYADIFDRLSYNEKVHYLSQELHRDYGLQDNEVICEFEEDN